jgi:sulfide:quinone oxidoreductase
VAGLETLWALRALAGDRAELMLVAPKGEFVYRPLGIKAPFEVGRLRRVSLDVAVRDAGAAFIAGKVQVVSPERKSVTTSGADRLSYDALVLAAGAEPQPAVEHAMTWDDCSGSEMVGGLIRDCEEGYVRSLAVVIPPGPGWPLRGYELALTITFQAKGMGIDLATTVIVQEPSPLWVPGSRTVEVISRELTGAGISIVSARRV